MINLTKTFKIQIINKNCFNNIDFHLLGAIQSISWLKGRFDKEEKMVQEKFKTLSKNVRKMKFMQRGLDERQRQELEEHDPVLAANENWSLQITCHVAKRCKYDTFMDFTDCEQLRYGRMSFGGFNKPLEKLLREADREEQGGDSDASIGDEEMAKHFTKVNPNVAKKFKKRKSAKRSDSEEEDSAGEVDVKKRKVDEAAADGCRRPDKVRQRGFIKPKL